MVLWLLKPIIVTIISLGSIKLIANQNKATIDRIGMGIFRDIGRYKAMKRRNMNTKGLISTLMKQDNLNEQLNIILNEDNNRDNLQTYTIQELIDYGSGIDGQSILIGLLGYVYDVTAGEKFYGEFGSYYMFAGHDITYSLATGCKTNECVNKIIDNDITILNDNELNEAKRWLSFFHMHDKYPLVGKVESNYVDILLDNLIQQNGSNSNTISETDMMRGIQNNEPNNNEINDETKIKIESEL